MGDKLINTTLIDPNDHGNETQTLKEPLAVFRILRGSHAYVEKNTSHCETFLQLTVSSLGH